MFHASKYHQEKIRVFFLNCFLKYKRHKALKAISIVLLSLHYLDKFSVYPQRRNNQKYNIDEAHNIFFVALTIMMNISDYLL